MRASKAHILLVEDDVSLGYVIKDNLMVAGFEVELCDDGEKGLESFNQHKYDLCILDVMLPKIDGFTLAENIRTTNKNIPILFLTAKSMKEDRISGFKKGGDDYITKPFSIEELILRIEVFLKRSSNGFDTSQLPETFEIGQYQFDHPNLCLSCKDQKKILTQREADLLRLLYLKRDAVLKREEILKTLWGDDDYFLGRSLDVFISKLRKYLKLDDSIEIVNYHGVGFRLEIKN